MEVKWNKKYNTIAIYALLVFFASIVFYLIASQVNVFKLQVFSYLSVFTPIIIGFVFAYLFNFILEFYEKRLLHKINKSRTKRIIGVILTYLTVLFIVFLFLKFIFPQLLESLIGLVNEIPNYVKDVSIKVAYFADKLEIDPNYNEIIFEKWNEFVTFIIQFATDLIPKIGNMTKSIVSSIWNIVLGMIVSIYLLMDKERFLALNKKITYGVLPKKGADRAIELVHRGDNIFGKFLSGKILDSIIVGILMFIILFIFKMPYAHLVAFIVGLTNIIPFFGPLIGAIPSFFIILFESPSMALWFLVIVFVVQQIDGNIIGPKILGDSLGISAFWILFSLLVGGKIFGFIGLIIGVPLFVFIYSIIKDIIENQLERKNLPIDTDYYRSDGDDD